MVAWGVERLRHKRHDSAFKSTPFWPINIMVNTYLGIRTYLLT